MRKKQKGHNRELTLLLEKAAVWEEALVNRMTDPDGLIYAKIHSIEQRPLRDSDFSDEVVFNAPSIPPEFRKAAFFGYEDSNMATGEFLLASLYQYKRTQERTVEKRCRRLFGALKAVAMAGSRYEGRTTNVMLGYLPKPYGGIRYTHLSGEVSVDQYLKTMSAMELYRNTLASNSEKLWIDSFFRGAANCWDKNNYTFTYFGDTCRWGMGALHSVAFGLYVSAWGKFLGNPYHENWFRVFLDRAEIFSQKAGRLNSDNVAGLVAQAMSTLCRIRSAYRKNWIAWTQRAVISATKRVDSAGYDWSFPTYRENNKLIKPHWDTKGTTGYWRFMNWRGNLRRPTPLLAGAAADLYGMTGETRWATLTMNHLQKFIDCRCLLYIEPMTSNDLPKGYEILGQQECGLNTAAWVRACQQLAYLLMK